MVQNHIGEKEIRPSILQRKGCPLYYWLTGQENHPLVVFTHGALVDHRTFEPQIPVMAQRYRVLTWDVRGHGQSQPMGVPFTVREAVEDLVALLDVVGYQQAILVGQSMGGNIAQEMVFLHPQRVVALVDIDSTCNTLKLSSVERAMLWLAKPLFHLYPHELLKKQSAQQSTVKPEVRQYLYEAMSQLSKDNFITIMMGTSLCLHYEPNYTITQPLLLIRGEYEQLGNIKTAMPRWAARDSQSQYVVVPDAGHCSNQDNPQFVNTLLLDFLQKVAP
jgi:pimeloyl-ACP methyl ester carboxylesterase